ncbi:MAG: glycosyltransferase family 2 protein [Alphaproteobacteria bacterium]|nr:glycosyltransferase family 2 protein [Alphaproteobacteria bacterium]
MLTDVSIIIPVHNKSSYLGRCLASVRSQTLPSIQIICIDDHSCDGSADILREAAAADPRVQLISNDHNLGPGASQGDCMNLEVTVRANAESMQVLSIRDEDRHGRRSIPGRPCIRSSR